MNVVERTGQVKTRRRPQTHHDQIIDPLSSLGHLSIEIVLRHVLKGTKNQTALLEIRTREVDGDPTELGRTEAAATGLLGPDRIPRSLVLDLALLVGGLALNVLY